MKKSNRRIYTVLIAASLAGAMILSTIGGCAPQAPAGDGDKVDLSAREPCTPEGAPKPKIMPADPGSAAPKQPRRMWATSYRWTKAPDLVVEKWLTEKPETKGKYVLI